MIQIRRANTPPETYPAELAAWAKQRAEAFAAHFKEQLRMGISVPARPPNGWLKDWDMAHPMPIYLPSADTILLALTGPSRHQHYTRS